MAFGCSLVGKANIGWSWRVAARGPAEWYRCDFRFDTRTWRTTPRRLDRRPIDTRSYLLNSDAGSDLLSALTAMIQGKSFVSHTMAGQPRAISCAIRKQTTYTASCHRPRKSRVLVFGEMGAVLWAQSKYDAAIRLEELWNELPDLLISSLLCVSSGAFREPLTRDRCREICGQHS